MTDYDKLHDYIKDADEDKSEPSKETAFYLNTFHAYDGFPRFASWNWAAFLFGPFWFVYRKMYLYAFYSLIIAWISGGAGSALFGIFGNAIYRYSLEERIQQNNENKGTSTIAVLIVLTVSVLIGLLIYFSLLSNVYQFRSN